MSGYIGLGSWAQPGTAFLLSFFCFFFFFPVFFFLFFFCVLLCQITGVVQLPVNPVNMVWLPSCVTTTNSRIIYKVFGRSVELPAGLLILLCTLVHHWLPLHETVACAAVRLIVMSLRGLFLCCIAVESMLVGAVESPLIGWLLHAIMMV